MKLSTQLRIFAALAAMLPALTGAQAFPTKPIRMIVAFPPGGGTDIVARLIAPRLGSALGQQVVIDNHAGADGVLGTELAAKSPPDGYTLFIGTAGNLAINQTLYGKVPFNIARDFMAVTQVVSVDMMLTVHPSLPVRTVSDLIALAKAKRGELNYFGLFYQSLAAPGKSRVARREAHRPASLQRKLLVAGLFRHPGSRGSAEILRRP